MQQLDDKGNTLQLFQEPFLSLDRFLFILLEHNTFAELLQRNIHIVRLVLGLIHSAKGSFPNAGPNLEICNFRPSEQGRLTEPQILYH